MSRLIFEGNTRDRFGELFPKPFIEEIRVFDTTIETDVAVYFEVPEGLTAEEFLEETGMDQLRVYIGPIGGQMFEKAQSFDIGVDFSNPTSVIYADVDGNYAFWAASRITEYITKTLGEYGLAEETEIDVRSFRLNSSNSEFFYNSDGTKFLKFLITDDTWQYISTIAGGQYIIAVCYFENIPNDEKILSNTSLFGKQFSDVAYHKVLTDSGALNTGRQIVYLESDGNYYSNVPLRGLDRIYRKVNLITHQQAQDLIQATIQSYIEIIPEADLISETLQKFSNDPNLLLEIQKNINNFSNKSSATVIGTLYGELVDVVVEIDNILTRSEKVEKRLIFSSKISDRRLLGFNPGEQIDVSATQHLSPDDVPLIFELGDSSATAANVRQYLDIPFFSRYVYRTGGSVGSQPASDPDNYTIENFMYLFFDYEKSLNYLSEISRFFNPYNIFQIFGKNCLNKYFKVQSVYVYKKDSDSGPDATAGNSDLRATLFTTSKNEFDYFSSDTDLDFSEASPFGDAGSTAFGNADYQINSRLIERAFDTVEGLNDYRLKCYETAFLESATQGTQQLFRFIRATINLNDTTMQFFNEHIFQKMLSLKNELEDYLTSAEQFCSFNNIDGRFNDFFADGVQNEFPQPYVWEEAPKYYYAISSLIETSWLNSDTTSDRNKDGTLINMEAIKELSIVKNSEINPTTGNLQNLRDFYNQFSDFMDVIGYGSDWASRIWDERAITTTGESFLQLKVPQKDIRISLDKIVSNYIVDNIEFDYSSSDTQFAKASAWQSGATIISLEDVEAFLDVLANMPRIVYTRDSRPVQEGGQDERDQGAAQERMYSTKSNDIGIFDFLIALLSISNNYMDNTQPSWQAFIEGGHGDSIVDEIENLGSTEFTEAVRSLYYEEVKAGSERIDNEANIREVFQLLVPSIEAYNNHPESDKHYSIKGFIEDLLGAFSF